MGHASWWLNFKIIGVFFPLRGIAGQLETINKTIQITRTLVFSGIIRHLHSTKLLSKAMQRAPAIKNKRKTNYTLKKTFLQIDPFQYSNKQNSNRHTSGPIISNFFRCNIWCLDAHDIQLILFLTVHPVDLKIKKWMPCLLGYIGKKIDKERTICAVLWDPSHLGTRNSSYFRYKRRRCGTVMKYSNCKAFISRRNDMCWVAPKTILPRFYLKSTSN